MSALGSLVVKLALQHAEFTGGLDKSEQAALAASKRIQDTFDGMKSRIAATAGAIAGGLAAGFTINAFKGLVSGAIETGAALDDLSQQTGAAVEGLSAMLAVGKFNDVGPERLGSAMNKLASNLAGATEESKGTGKALEYLGINVEEFRKLKPEEQMTTLAKSLAELPEGANKSAVAMALLGKEGAQMLPFMNDLATVGELQAKVTTEQAAAAANLDDNLKRLSSSGDGWKKELANGMIPALDQGAQALLDVMNGTGGLREKVKGLAADGSIKEWTRNAIMGFSYVADVVQGLMSMFPIMGKAIGAAMAATSEVVSSVYSAFQKIRGGDLGGAMTDLETGFSRVKTIGVEAGQDISEVWNQKLFGERLRERMNELETGTAGAGDAADKASRKMGNFVNVTEKTGKAAAEAKDPVAALLDTIGKRTAAYAGELAAGEKLTEGEKAAIEVLDQLRTGKVKVTQAEAELIGVRVEAMLVTEKQATLYQLELKQLEAARAERVKLFQSMEQGVTSLAEQNKSLSEEIELIGLSEQAQLAVIRGRNDRAIATKAATLAEMELQAAVTGTMTREQIALQQEIELLKERNGLLGQKFDATEGAKLVEGQKAAWQDMWSSVDRTAHDVFVDVADNGMGAFKRIGQTLKASVLDLLYQMTIRQWVFQIMASVSGSFGGAAGGMGAGGGAIGTIANGASLATNAYGLYSQGLGGTAIGQFYSGYTGATLAPGMMGPSATPITMWSQGGNVLGGAGGTGMSGGMGTFGVYAAVAALIANAVGAFRERKQVDSGLVGTLGKGDLMSYALWRESGTLFGGPDYDMMNPGQLIADKEAELARRRASGEEAGPALYTLEQEIKNLKELYGSIIESTKAQSDSIQAAYSALRTNVGDMADVLGLSSDAVRNFTMALDTGVINGDTGERGMQLGGLTDAEVSAKINEALATANNTLAEQVIGAWVPFTETISRTVDNIVGTGENAEHVFETVTETTTGMRYVASEYARDGEKAIDTLTRLATSLSTVNKIWDTLGYTLLDASLAGGDFASSLVDAFGGLEAMVSKFDSYYQNFYTEGERRDKAREQLQTQLNDLGMENVNFDDPKAREQYRAAVDAAIARASKQDANRRALSSTLAGMDLSALKPGDLSDALKGFGGGTATPEALAGLASSLQDLGASSKGLGDFQQAISDYITTNADALGIEDDAAATAAALIDLSGSFAAVTQASEDAAAAAEEQRAAYEQSLDDAYSALEAAMSREIQALEAQRDSVQEVADAWKAVRDAAAGGAEQLYGMVQSTVLAKASAGVDYILQALDVARSGAAPDSERLSQAISDAISGINSKAYASTFERDRDALVLAGRLSQLEEAGGKQLTTAEQTLESINRQVKQGQDTLDYWKQQIDLAKGNVAATQSVAAAIDTLRGLMFPTSGGNKPGGSGSGSGAVFGGSSGAGGGTAKPPAKYSQVTSLGTAGVGYIPIEDPTVIARLDELAPVYHQFDGTGDLVGLANAFRAAGGSVAELSMLSGLFESDWRAALANAGIPAFEKGGDHMGGWAVVGEAGPELAYMPPARIYNAAQTRQMMGGMQGTGGGDFRAFMASLLTEFQGLRTEVREVKQQTKRGADVLENASEGAALRTTPA